MTETNVNDMFQAALRHHQAGRLPEASEIYHRVLALQPEHADATAMLAVVASQLKRPDVAERWIQKAIALSPNSGEHHYNHGRILAEAGRIDEAIAAYRRAIALQPKLAEPHFGLANILNAQGKYQQAVESFQQVVSINPGFADAHNNLGNALAGLGRKEEALAAYRKALEIQPNHVAALSNLGNYLFSKGKLDEAIAAWRKAVALDPNHAVAVYNLGTTLGYKREVDESADLLRRAVTLNPSFVNAIMNLGNALRDSGEMDEAFALYRRALKMQPNDLAVFCNLVYSLHFHPGYSAEALFAELSEWDRRMAQPLRTALRPHENDRTPDRRLKIGYVSSEFWAQAEAHFVLPLLEAHDHQRFEIVCYSTGDKIDALTQRHRQCADVWVEALSLSDADLAERIRADRIDILVDLNMHMRSNRLLTFARKPAPIQVTWLAYPGGTGLRTMDYRFTDPFMDPPEERPAIYCEQSVPLGDCWCAYDPLIDLPPAPPRADGPIRFGSLNNPCKMNDGLLRLWAAVLRAVSDSQLILLCNSLRQQQRIRDLLKQEGIAPTRVDFVRQIRRPEYLKIYHRIDIALDTLPYNGITTTCDAMWMGVPVVSLTGATACGRAGLSLISAVGLGDLVARQPEDFVDTAAGLAGDPARLANLRATLRQTMSRSSLMDGKFFASEVEAAYRRMWHRWCADKSPK